MSVDVTQLPEPPAGARARRWKTAGRYALMTMLAAAILFPIYMTLVNSVQPFQYLITKHPSLYPRDFTWTYSRAWDTAHFSVFLKNSFVMSGVIVVAQVFTSILAGYAFAYLRFPLKTFLFVLFLVTLMIPIEVTFITNLQTMRDLSLFNTYGGLTLPFLATGFGAFLLRQAFLAVPSELRDAAELDGYGHWRFMFQVAVPLIRPAVAALAVFAFLTSYSQYLWPLLVTSDSGLRTVQIGLRQFAGANVRQINGTFAAAIIASLPLFVLLIAFSKQLIRGLTAGAVKG